MMMEGPATIAFGRFFLESFSSPVTRFSVFLKHYACQSRHVDA